MQKSQFVHNQQLGDSSDPRWIAYRTSLIPAPEICNPFIFDATVAKSYTAGSYIETPDRILKSRLGQPVSIPICQNRPHYESAQCHRTATERGPPSAQIPLHRRLLRLLAAALRDRSENHAWFPAQRAETGIGEGKSERAQSAGINLGWSPAGSETR